MLGTLGLAMLIGGQLWQGISGHRAATRAARDRRTASGMLSGGIDPELQNLLLGSVGLAPHMGQDGIMQMFRRGPSGQQANFMMGQPFDTTDLFKSLAPLEQRQLDESISQMRAGATGLGGRFGSAALRAEQDMRTTAGQQASALRSQIAMQAHESAAQRQMDLLNLRTQLSNIQSNTLLNLLGLDSQRQMGAAQILGGQPAVSPLGGSVAQIGQLMYLMPMLQELLGGNGGSQGGGFNPLFGGSGARVKTTPGLRFG